METPANTTTPSAPPLITYDAFDKLVLRVATILDATEHPDPKVDKLVVLKVSLGDTERQIVAGIKKHYTPEQLKGKQIAVLCNLEPRKLRGQESNGMLLAATDEEGNLALLVPDKPIKAGSSIK